MHFLNVNFENHQSILQSFDKIADRIANNVTLTINKAHYRIVDFEFYCWSENFPDPHTYKNDLQLQRYKLYLHASGVDITFGDHKNYGGILLRSIIKRFDGAEQDEGFMKKQFTGPQVLTTELFANLYSLDSQEPNFIEVNDNGGHNMDDLLCLSKTIIKTKRIGLTEKEADKENYYKDLPLRYIAILPNYPNFRQKIAGIESILGEQVLKGKMTQEQEKEILGYNKTFY